VVYSMKGTPSSDWRMFLKCYRLDHSKLDEGDKGENNCFARVLGG
jgi:hypothetical protein